MERGGGGGGGVSPWRPTNGDDSDNINERAGGGAGGDGVPHPRRDGWLEIDGASSTTAAAAVESKAWNEVTIRRNACSACLLAHHM